jgi:hypothetical protein
MKANAGVKTFDDLEIHRPELARGYLQLLNAQPHRPIALFAPRREKTAQRIFTVGFTVKTVRLGAIYVDRRR